MPPMDLLLVSRCPPFPLNQGDRLILYHLARQLASRGHRIDLLAFHTDADDSGETFHYEHFFRDVRLIPEPRRSAVAYMKRLARPFPRRAEQAWSSAMWNAVSAQLATHRYDVVQLFGGIQVYECRELVRHMPNVIVPYESYSLFLERQLGQERQWSRRVTLWAQLATARRYEQLMFEGYDAVVVISDADQRTLHSLAPRLPIHVIPIGVDINYFKPAENEPEQATLLFLGNYAYAPNADAAVQLAQRIFPIVKRQVPQARLVLVGSNPTDAISSLASRDIEVTGHVPDVRPYLERATIFVSPLRFGAGMKDKILEAMALGKPVVATPLSLDGICGPDGGEHALVADTPDGLASAALSLLGDAPLRHRMGQANRQLIEARFTWGCAADQYEALYGQLITGEG
jgi:polysaccharide biosynthesis protein PslH